MNSIALVEEIKSLGSKIGYQDVDSIENMLNEFRNLLEADETEVFDRIIYKGIVDMLSKLLYGYGNGNCCRCGDPLPKNAVGIESVCYQCKIKDM